jgi:parvulin-like peptidyl-prolyl isomerase
MLPQVRVELEKLKVGQVSAPIKVPDGIAVMYVLEIRHPNDPKAKAEAERASLESRQVQALTEFYKGLVKRYAKIDKATFQALDFQAQKPGLEALRKDPRVLAEIQGAKPITVAELTEEIMGGFFHGVERAQKEGKINAKKEEIFDGMLARRVIPLQLAAEGIPASPELKRRVADYRIGVLFSKFVEKAIGPTLKVDEAAARKHWAANKKDFMYPTFYKLESLAFSNVKDAEAAVQKLRAGTDFKWLNANADGQIPPAQRRLGIEGTLAATAMPKEIVSALASAKKGDYRLHAGPDSQFYAIRVVDVIGAKERPFEEVRDEILTELRGEEITASVKRWAGIIRKARKVDVFLTRIGS